MVTPAYMAANFINDAMASVWRQSYRPIEHIVVDDGSPDTTGSRAVATAERLNGPGYLARVIRHESNSGTAAALNTGIAAAQGSFISWLSADDLFVSQNKTARQIAELERDRCLAGVFDLAALIGADPATARLVRPRWPRLMRLDPRLQKSDPESMLVGLLFANPINGTSVTLRRAAVPWKDLFDTADSGMAIYDQDSDLWMRMQAVGLRMRGLQQAGTLYRIHPGQSSNKQSQMQRASSISRIRILLGLDKMGRLGPVLQAGRVALSLGVASGVHRYRPAVFSALADVGTPKLHGVVRSVLELVSRDLDRRPLTEHQLWRSYRSTAQELMDSSVFSEFESSLVRIAK